MKRARSSRTGTPPEITRDARRAGLSTGARTPIILVDASPTSRGPDPRTEPLESMRAAGPGRRGPRSWRAQRAPGHPRRPSTGHGPLVVGVPLGLLVCAALVWQSSYAAFTATTTAKGTWVTGQVVLHDDDGSGVDGTATGTALFDAAGLMPGSTGSRCLAVTYAGTLPAAVRFHATVTGTLGDHLSVTVEEGSGGGFGSCDGFAAGRTLFSGTLASLGATHRDWATATPATLPWAPTGPATRTYRVTYTLSGATPTSAQGATANATLTWEARSP